MGTILLIFETEAEALDVLATINANMGLPDGTSLTWDTVELRTFSDGNYYSIIEPKDEHLTGDFETRSADDVVILDPLTATEIRQATIEQLKQAAKDFAELIEDEELKAAFLQSIKAFFFDNSDVITHYIINGGDEVRTLFETSQEHWLDMKPNEETPTPREYALNLLN